MKSKQIKKKINWGGMTNSDDFQRATHKSNN